MPLNGDIKTFSISAISRLIHSENKTGVLRVTSGEFTSCIYFKNGQVIFVSSTLAEDLSLSSLLKASNVINEETIQKSLKLSQTTGKRLGVILLEQDYLSQNQLVNILRHQFKELLARVLSWEEGVFNYTNGLNGFTEDIRLALDPTRLMAEALQWKEFRSLIPNDNVVFKIKSGDFKPDLLSSDSVSRVMLLINGKRNVSQIIDDTGLSRLAVYRSLAALASQGAITGDKRVNRNADPKQPDKDTFIKFYLNLFNEITTELTVELGRQKALFLLVKSLKRTPYYNSFLCAYQPDKDAAANFDLIQNYIQNQKKSFLRQDLINGFNLAVFNLLQEEYQLLGLGALKNTVHQTNAVLDLAPRNQQPLARTLGRFLNQLCEDEDLLRGIKSLPETVMQDKRMPSAKKQAMSHSIENIEGASIIAFYNIIIQILNNDLEQEIGAKASNLFQDVLMNSKYYDKFLSQFNINDTVDSNVNRISDHVKNRGYKLNKQDMVLAFQQVIFALLQAENQFLGNKAVRTSLSKIKEHTASQAARSYKPLADLLIAFLKNVDFQ